MPRYARVLVDESGSHAFDYELPADVAGELQIGSRVRVPVRTRTALGTIIELRDETDATGGEHDQQARMVAYAPLNAR